MFWGHIKGQQLCIKYTWYQHLNFCNRSQIFVWHLNDKDYPKPWTYCSMFYSNGEPTSLYICYSTIIVSDLLSMLNTKLKFLIRFKNICGWGYISPFRQASNIKFLGFLIIFLKQKLRLLSSLYPVQVWSLCISMKWKRSIND